MVLKKIHAALEEYDRKYVKCNQLTRVREEKHYNHHEILDIYLKLAAKYNEREDKQRTFGSIIEEYKKKLDELLAARRRYVPKSKENIWATSRTSPPSAACAFDYTNISLKGNGKDMIMPSPYLLDAAGGKPRKSREAALANKIQAVMRYA